MVIGFCFIGGWCYSGWWVWDLITLAQFSESDMSPGLFQDFMDVYIRLFPLVVEHSVVVMSARLNPMGGQFSIPVSWNLCSESVVA